MLNKPSVQDLVHCDIMYLVNVLTLVFILKQIQLIILQGSFQLQ